MTESTAVVPVDPQYPSAIVFNGLADVAQLATDYGKYVSIDADSATQIKKLVKAVKEVSKARLTVDKEKTRLLDPANKYRALISEEYKVTVLPYKTLEDNLKKEKKRVDDIQEQRLAEQRKLWGENVNVLLAKGHNLVGASMEQLQAELDIIELHNFDDFDYGELIEDAKAAKANAHARVSQAIEQEKQRIHLKEQQDELDRQAEQRRLDDAKRELEQAHESAIHENEMFDMKAKLVKAERTNEIKQQTASKPAVADMSDKGFAGAIGMASGSTINTGHAAEPLAGAVNSFDDIDPEPVQKVISEDDQIKMNTFVGRLKAQIDMAPVDFVDQDCARAVNRVVENLNKTVGFLASVAKGGEA